MRVRTLYIDLAGAERAFALCDGGRFVGSANVDDHKAEDKLLPAVDKLLQDAGWTRADVRRIAVVTGPGGFMTIRVALSMANAMAYALKIPLAGIHLSDVWKARIAESDCVWLHSTKKTHAFARGFGSFAKRFPEAELRAIADLRSELPKDAPWMGELIPEHLAALPEIRRIAKSRPLDAVLPGLLDGLAYEEKTLLPWYGRGA